MVKTEDVVYKMAYFIFIICIKDGLMLITSYLKGNCIALYIYKIRGEVCVWVRSVSQPSLAFPRAFAARAPSLISTCATFLFFLRPGPRRTFPTFLPAPLSASVDETLSPSRAPPLPPSLPLVLLFSLPLSV